MSETSPLCACGCGQHVNWNKTLKQWSKYRLGHYSKTQKKEPKGQAPLCACGCGLSVTWSKTWLRWNRFAFGHNSTNHSRREQREPPPLCACGCGKSVRWNRSARRWNQYINHHVNRTPEYRKNQSQKHTTPEMHAIYVETANRCLLTPEARAKSNKTRRKLFSTPEYSEFIKSRIREYWSNPENKAKHVAILQSAPVKKRRAEAMARRMARGDIHPRGHGGYFESTKMRCTIYYASSYEARFMAWCEQSPDVKTFKGFKLHHIRIPYFNPRKNIHTWYYPDILLELDNSITILCEVKASAFVNKYSVQLKATVATEWCKTQGYKYCIITEHTLEALETNHIDDPAAFLLTNNP